MKKPGTATSKSTRRQQLLLIGEAVLTYAMELSSTPRKPMATAPTPTDSTRKALQLVKARTA